MRNHLILSAFCAMTVAACDRGAPEGEAEGSAPPAAVEVARAEVPAPEPTQVEASAEKLYEMTVPVGLVEDSRESNAVHFRTELSVEALIEFVGGWHPNFRASTYPEGATFEDRSGTGRAIYIYESRRNGVMVSYFAHRNPGVAGAVADDEIEDPAPDVARAQQANTGEPVVVERRGPDGVIERRMVTPSRRLNRGTSFDPGQRPLTFENQNYEPPRNPNAYF